MVVNNCLHYFTKAYRAQRYWAKDPFTGDAWDNQATQIRPIGLYIAQGGRDMELNGERLDSIVVTADRTGRLVTADDNKEVIAVISEDGIICMNGYNVKMVPATDV